MNKINSKFDPIDLFSEFMKVTTVPHLGPEKIGDERLIGKTLGVVGASIWISLWQSYFAKQILPGVKIVSAGSDAVQYNFLKAHSIGAECPPQINKRIFAEQAVQLHELIGVDAILSTCSTMNRSFPVIQKAMDKYNVPVVQIDMPMMEQAVIHGGKILVIATHGPTIENTKLLLSETGKKLGKPVLFSALNILKAYDDLVEGNIREHNNAIEKGIRKVMRDEPVEIVVLAQLSMSVFKLSYPDCEKEFGVPVLTSAECGFNRVKEMFINDKGDS
jgi:aspartate/glutamate racemase